MTAHQIKVNVSDPADTRRRVGYVTLKPVPALTGREWEVYHGGELVGTVNRRRHIPHTKIPGTRLRKDLAPRTVWDAFTTDRRRDSLTYERRNDALFYLIKPRTA